MAPVLGPELKSRREALGMAIDDVAREAHVASRYIAALEESGYHVFPAKVYAAGAVRRMSDVFASDDTEALIEALNREWPQGFPDAAVTPPAPRTFSMPRIRLTPRRIGLAATGAFALFLLGFWGLRIFLFALPPMLVIESPSQYARIETPAAIATGRTEKESRLTVNGREITIDEHGNFEVPIELQPGVNTLRFSSESRFGKTTEEVRHVLAE